MRNSSKLLIAAGILLVGLSTGKATYAQEQSLSVTGNGSGSVNNATTVQNQSTFVTQTNNSTVTNNVVVDANTGNNTASSNTNDPSNISTGSIASNVLVNNTLGANAAAACCSSAPDPTSALISRNGAYSNNQINQSQVTTTVLNQTNSTSVANKVGGDLNTGNNSTSSNVGGPNHISTGDIFSHIGISNILNSNAATIGCCSLTNAEPPAGGVPTPSIPVAAILPTPGQVLAASKVAVLPNTGAGDTMWVMSLASLVLLLGFVVRKSAASALIGIFSA